MCQAETSHLKQAAVEACLSILNQDTYSSDNLGVLLKSSPGSERSSLRFSRLDERTMEGAMRRKHV